MKPSISWRHLFLRQQRIWKGLVIILSLNRGGQRPLTVPVLWDNLGTVLGITFSFFEKTGPRSMELSSQQQVVGQG
jgi:hypothetical protein